jgi:hypothetical protein
LPIRRTNSVEILDDNKSLIVEEKQEDNSSMQSIQPHIDKDVEYFVNRFKNTEKNI